MAILIYCCYVWHYLPLQTILVNVLRVFFNLHLGCRSIIEVKAVTRVLNSEDAYIQIVWNWVHLLMSDVYVFCIAVKIKQQLWGSSRNKEGWNCFTQLVVHNSCYHLSEFLARVLCSVFLQDTQAFSSTMQRFLNQMQRFTFFPPRVRRKPTWKEREWRLRMFW